METCAFCTGPIEGQTLLDIAGRGAAYLPKPADLNCVQCDLPMCHSHKILWTEASIHGFDTTGMDIKLGNRCSVCANRQGAEIFKKNGKSVLMVERKML